MLIPFEDLPTGQQLVDMLAFREKPIPFDPVSSKHIYHDEFDYVFNWIRKQREPQTYSMGVITFENAWPEDFEFLRVMPWNEGQ